MPRGQHGDDGGAAPVRHPASYTALAYRLPKMLRRHILRNGVAHLAPVTGSTATMEARPR